MYQYPDYLTHYGIPGMKWGVRKARRKLKKASRLKQKASEERAYQKELKRYGMVHPDVVDLANETKEKNYKYLYSRTMSRDKYDRYFYDHKDTLKSSYEDLMRQSKASEKNYEERAKKLIDKYGSKAV